jgi:hypothetical protein
VTTRLQVGAYSYAFCEAIDRNYNQRHARFIPKEMNGKPFLVLKVAITINRLQLNKMPLIGGMK